MTDAGDALAPGTRLDEFEIERVLGAGGFGVTYLARDLSLDTWRAVKEYLPRDWGTRRGDGTIGPRTAGDTEDYRWGLERFLEEARILARFDHPHLVRVYRVFEAYGTAYLVTEYVEGRTLTAEVDAEGPLSEARVRDMLAALTDGLSVVHAAGLLHRDIKPGNVIVRPDGTPVLIDFGAARQAIGRHSRSVTAVLTPGYAPIEQYSARGNQGPWTDIYALGAVAYWALGGEVPEDATERVRNDRLRPLTEVARRRVSARLAKAIDAALAVTEGDRPQSLEEWRELLDMPATRVAAAASRVGTGLRVGSEAPTSSAGGDELPRSGGAMSRRWLLPAAAAAGILSVALAMALIATSNGSSSDAEREGGPAVDGLLPLAPSTGADPDGAGGIPTAERSGDAAAAKPAQEVIEDGLGLDAAARMLLQTGLAAAGFDVGEPDGQFGPQTRAALREWQAARGMVATGYLDRESAAVLRAEAVTAEAERTAAEAAEAAEAEAVRATEAGIDFGDDSGDYANDGDCDDIRFEGDRGGGAIDSNSHIMRDATDCRNLFRAGRISYTGRAAGAASGIDFGDDSGDYTNDGDCDDTRFEGDRGSAAWEANDDYVRRDATDCRNLFLAGQIWLR